MPEAKKRGPDIDPSGQQRSVPPQQRALARVKSACLQIVGQTEQTRKVCRLPKGPRASALSGPASAQGAGTGHPPALPAAAFLLRKRKRLRRPWRPPRKEQAHPQPAALSAHSRGSHPEAESMRPPPEKGSAGYSNPLNALRSGPRRLLRCLKNRKSARRNGAFAAVPPFLSRKALSRAGRGPAKKHADRVRCPAQRVLFFRLFPLKNSVPAPPGSDRCP